MTSIDRRQVDETELAQNTKISVQPLFEEDINCAAFLYEKAAQREKASSLRSLETSFCEARLGK